MYIAKSATSYLFRLARLLENCKVKQKVTNKSKMPCCFVHVRKMLFKTLTWSHKVGLPSLSVRADFIKSQMDKNRLGNLTAIYLLECLKSIYFGLSMLSLIPLTLKSLLCQSFPRWVLYLSQQLIWLCLEIRTKACHYLASICSFEHVYLQSLNGVFPKWSKTLIEFSKFREADKSLKHELGSL